jgi:hypothetical protein
VTDECDSRDIPARICTHCATPLPHEFGDRPIRLIAVVGTPTAGKSHYLAAVLKQAAREQQLKGVGCVEFAPDGLTAPRFQHEYFLPVFSRQRQLRATHPDPDVATVPLVFQVQFEDCDPCLLLFHDVAGETLSDFYDRAAHAEFLRRADGVIFLIDPLSVTDPWGRPLASHAGATAMSPEINQADLLNGCIEDIGTARAWTTPFAIALSKADLIAAQVPWANLGLGLDPQYGTRDEWRITMAHQDTLVRRILADARAGDILQAASRLNPRLVSFHAIAPIGSSPTDGRIDVLRPARCLDPLAKVLSRIPNLMTAD